MSFPVYALSNMKKIKCSVKRGDHSAKYVSNHSLAI